jgi:hypothetical protein
VRVRVVDQTQQICTWTFGTLLGHLQKALAWPDEKIHAAMDLLSLGPLGEYPPTQNRADCYPWRFSRNRSSVRRPLLCRTNNDVVDIVWGPAPFIALGATYSIKFWRIG